MFFETKNIDVEQKNITEYQEKTKIRKRDLKEKTRQKTKKYTGLMKKKTLQLNLLMLSVFKKQNQRRQKKKKERKKRNQKKQKKRQEGKKKKKQERDREREIEQVEGQKRLRRNKGRHSTINKKNALFQGENWFFSLRSKGRNQKKQTKKKKQIRRV